MLTSPDQTASRPRLSVKAERIVIVVILLIYTSMVAWGSYRNSPIADEPAYLASGISHWQFGHFELCKVSPPLVRLVASLPAYLSGARADEEFKSSSSFIRLEHHAGRQFLERYGEKSYWYFTIARWACTPFALLGALVCYFWSREWFGSTAGIVCLLLWCTCPNVLAHAQMMNADVGVTSLALATCFVFWKSLKETSYWMPFIAGIVLGLAILAKTNAVVLPPVICVAVFIYRYLFRGLELKTQLLQICLAFFVALYVINLGYGGYGSFTPLKNYHFSSEAFSVESSTSENSSWVSTIARQIPIPLPTPFLEGIDLQKRDFENSRGNFRTYLRGEWYYHSWWWYYLYVVAVKVPVGTWVLLLLGVYVLATRIERKKSTSILCFAVLPGVAMFALASMQTGFGAGVRYVLPAFPFAFLVGSAVFSQEASRRIRWIGAVALLLGPIGSLSTYPHSLCYFNWLAGGPKNGHFHLIDSNMEWGQNLIYVQEWLDKNADESPIYVAQWSFYPTTSLGFDYPEPPVNETDPIPPGTYLISTNFLRGNPDMRRMPLRRFLELEPAERIGYTTYVYRVPQTPLQN